MTVMAEEPVFVMKQWENTALKIIPTSLANFSDWFPLWNGIHEHHGSEPIDLEVSRRTFYRQAQGHVLQGALRGILAFLDEQPVGFAHFFVHQSSYQDEPVATLEDLFVAKEVRGKGIGKALLHEVIWFLQDLKVTELRWVTSTGNEPAIKLYSSVANQESMLCFRSFL